jgi:hypothetical protein
MRPLDRHSHLSALRNAALLAVLITALFGALAAQAGSLSGTISAKNGATPLTGPFEVRLWTVTTGPKPTASITSTITTAADGIYSFKNVGAGTYLIDCRGAAGAHDNLGDRWYDVAPPVNASSPGYIPEDADLLVLVTGTEVLTGLNIQMDVLAGMDGQITGALVSGQQVRCEAGSDSRIHHNTTSQVDPHLGLYSFRGLVPGASKLFAHDPLFRQDDSAIAGVTVTADTVLAGPAVAMPALPTDSFEGAGRNNTPVTGSDLDVVGACSGAAGGRCFAGPHSVFDSSSLGRTPFIGPINPSTGLGDVDFFCWNALPGDRYLITATAPLVRKPGGGLESPFVDPTVSYWFAGKLVLQDDDSLGQGYRAAAYLDTTTQTVTTAGRACAAVSTFGDVNFTGQNNQSGGRYQLRVELGNRKPSLAVSPSVDGVAKTAPVAMDEAQTLTLDLSFSDPDTAPDTLTLASTFTDRNGNPVAGSTLTRPAGTGTAKLVWPTTQVTAKLSPYRFTFTLSDGEYSAQAAVDVNVRSVNVAPTQPVQLAPATGTRVGTATPGLQVLNATDVDVEPDNLDFELYDTSGALIGSASIAQDPSGKTTWTTPPLPENSPVFWRVRANDGHVNDNCCSPWTGTWELIVDTVNSAPPVPQMVKPADGETAQVRAPALAATSVTDPEGDAVTLTFQLSADAAFTAPVGLDAAVSLIGPTTAANLAAPLPWGSVWYARVRATDSRGLSSDWSDVIHFEIKPDLAPPKPQLVGDFLSACQDHVFTLGPPPTVQVSHVEDPEGEAVKFDLQLFRFQDDPNATTPLYGTSQDQSKVGGPTAVDVSLFTAWADGAHYRVRARASDGTLASDFAECDFVLQQKQVLPDGGFDAGADGGTGSDAGTSDGGSGSDAGNNPDAGPRTAVASGCGCTTAPTFGPVLLLGLLLAMRRRPGRSRPARS